MVGQALAVAASGREWGVGLTPRLFEALRTDEKATLKAQDSRYVPIVENHVQSVEPSKQVLAQYWVPIVVEQASGTRQVLHADPIAVRRFRRSIAEELKHVQEKRRRMFKRITDIRQKLPETHPQVVAKRLQREIQSAEARIGDPLLQPLPSTARVLHVLIEVSPRTPHLGLVCERLLQELPSALEAEDVQYLTLSALSDRGPGASDGVPRPLLEPLQCSDAATWEAIEAWLGDLVAAGASLLGRPLKGIRRVKGTGTNDGSRAEREAAKAAAQGGGPSDLRLLPALKKAASSAVLGSDSSPGGGGGAVLLIASSPPEDVEAAAQIVKRRSLALQVVAVLGTCSEDAEPDFQLLVDAAASGSCLHLFFGPAYWQRYAAVQKRRLEVLQERIQAKPTAALNRAFDEEEDVGEIISDKVFEMRLIERLMRECYVEEQRCEEELRCASQVLERTAVPAEEIAAVLQGRPYPPTDAAYASTTEEDAMLAIEG